MQCLHPIGLKDKEGLVPCGKCAACLQRRRMDWTIRLTNELKESKNATFITLTYEERYLPIADDCVSLSKIDCQNFIKRLRKKCKQNLKYYLVGEYGEKTNRPHYHAIMFNVLPKIGPKENAIEKAWSIYDKKTNKYRQIGMVHFGKVEIKSIAYTAKYILQLNRSYNKKVRPFSLMSKGLGKEYINKNEKFHKKNLDHLYFPLEEGKKASLPRYYKDKLYDERERKKFEIRSKAKACKNYIRKQEEFERRYKGKKYFVKNLEAAKDYERKVKQTLKKGTL